MSIFLFHGNKGGVGKSTAAMAFVEYLRAGGHDPLIVDCDAENPDVARKYGGQLLTVDTAKGWGELADLADSRRDIDLVVSLPAQIGLAWESHAALFFDALREAGADIPVFVFFIINRQRDSIELLRRAQQTDPSGGFIKGWIAVKNLYFGDAEKFILWQNSKYRGTFLANNGAEIELPELGDWVADKLANGSKPISVAGEQPGDFTLSERTTIKRWIRDSGAEIARVAHLWAPVTA